jgi:hypothetical protein
MLFAHSSLALSREYHSSSAGKRRTPVHGCYTASLNQSATVTQALRSRRGAHRRISRLDPGRFRFLPGHALSHRDRQGVPQIGCRDRAFHHRDAGLSAHRRFLFGLLADRYGRRLPLMIDLVFYSIVEVLTGLAPNYTTFLVLRALFGIGMGGEWGVGASLAMEKVPPRLRGVLVGIAAGGLCRRQSARHHLLFLFISALGLAAALFPGRTSRVAGFVRPFPREGIRSLAQEPRRKLERIGARHHIALEAVRVSDCCS